MFDVFQEIVKVNARNYQDDGGEVVEEEEEEDDGEGKDQEEDVNDEDNDNEAT